MSGCYFRAKRPYKPECINELSLNEHDYLILLHKYNKDNSLMINQNGSVGCVLFKYVTKIKEIPLSVVEFMPNVISYTRVVKSIDPSTDNELDLIKDEYLGVLEKKGGKWLVVDRHGYQGWIDSGHVVKDNVFSYKPYKLPQSTTKIVSVVSSLPTNTDSIIQQDNQSTPTKLKPPRPPMPKISDKLKPTLPSAILSNSIFDQSTLNQQSPSQITTIEIQPTIIQHDLSPPPVPKHAKSIMDDTTDQDQQEAITPSNDRSSLLAEIQRGVRLNRVALPIEKSGFEVRNAPIDERSKIMNQIKEGTQLKHVNQVDSVTCKSMSNASNVSELDGIAGALARALHERRQHIITNDSIDEEETSDEEDNSDEWDDE